MRVGAVTPRPAEASAREGPTELQRSARRAAPGELRSNFSFKIRKTSLPPSLGRFAGAITHNL
jgi:hypothetical protein